MRPLPPLPHLAPADVAALARFAPYRGFAVVQLPGIRASRTVDLCTLLATISGRRPEMRDILVQLIGRPPLDRRELCRRIHRAVQRFVPYLAEPGEQVQTPGRTLLRRFGDCDDQATLVAALCEAAGIPWRISLLRDATGRPFHVWTEARLAGAWTSMETCRPEARFGEHPGAVMRRLRVNL